MITIYHNPRCSKSRQTLQLLQENGVEPEVFLYLETSFSKDVLLQAIKKLGRETMFRKNEDEYKSYVKPKLNELSDEELVRLMLEYPKVIERPLVVNGGKFAMGRPPENVLEII